MKKILIVDDEKMIRWTLAQALKSWGYIPIEVASVSETLETFANEMPQAVLLDIDLPDGSGLDLLRDIKHQYPEAVVIMITGNVRVETTISALRGGAYDFISKPIHLEELKVSIRNGLEVHELRREVKQIRSERSNKFSFEQIIGKSPKMKEMLSLAKKVAESEVGSVLLQGESGTGKDLVAKAIHYTSRRAEKPFVAINCAAIPSNLVESELFGYEKGAFTDAKSRKEGLFEQAEGGTLLLDEIGEMELGLQAKLLRVLEEGVFRRVGGLKDLPLDIRVIAASNRDLKNESVENRFRLDLYYRLSVIQIDIPPLRERDDDVILLAKYYLDSLGEKVRPTKKFQGFSPQVIDIFRGYEWAGNVRELRNVVERCLILEDEDTITATYLPHNLLSPQFRQAVGSNHQSLSDSNFTLPQNGISLEKVEDSLVEQAIEQCHGNQTHAAKLLGITRDQLRYRLKKIG
jgi:two-component system, NtrC family, response regulator AtoC